jgi:hypothetical protein
MAKQMLMWRRKDRRERGELGSHASNKLSTEV